MGLTELLKLTNEMPAYGRLVGQLRKPEGSTNAVVLDAARPFLLAALYRSLNLPMMVVTAQPEHCKWLFEQLSMWGAPVRLFPEPDGLPYERITPDASTEIERLQVLSALVSFGQGKNNLEERGLHPPQTPLAQRPQQGAPLILASAPALMQKTAPRARFAAVCHSVWAGMEIEPLRLLERWEAMGYRLEGAVEVPGTMSHRGGIIDVFPPASELPSRLEFFGNTVESIRLFDPATQRSHKEVLSVAVCPATELLSLFSGNRQEIEPAVGSIDLSGLNEEFSQRFRQETDMLLDKQRLPAMQFYAPLFNRDSLLDYLPQDAVIVLDDPSGIEQEVQHLHEEAEELRREELEGGELPADFPRPYFTWDELEPGIEGRRQLFLGAWGADDSEQAHMGFTSAPNYVSRLPAFMAKVRQLLDSKLRVIITSYQASRLSELLQEEDVIAAPVTEIKELPPRGLLTLVQGSLAEGWVAGNETYIFTDAEILGFTKQRRLPKKHPVANRGALVDIKPGDYVVHVEHGIGKLASFISMSHEGDRREYLVLQYAAGDKLYVPTDQVDRVSRYIVAGDEPPALSRLGTQECNKTRQKAKEAAEEIAQELLALYATREVVSGFAFSKDTVWQQEFEASFPYVETPDQMQAQQDVKADMEKPKPMDRLICGDVGYGKTEVAVRAAFKAVMDGKQVAVLVPTTVLAQQHLTTFSERMEAFPVKVEVLSRFRTHREQKVVLEGLADGSVDICIGTHRLLQKDVAFKNLGLVIIDEEQRFGVSHKEHLKQLRREVDVLTLSATPIPRTLHMSLVGVRDMSTMETPPEDRLPVKTYVAEFDDRLVREAILRELERNGQVFFVHNRVQSIDFIASKLQAMVPEAWIAVGHGQMHEDELEKVMTDFAKGKADVLVCTTIIESGLDMPNVNTLIVNRADRFGLTQLYQLRGRVGRGANLAYAYFLYEKGKRLTPTAGKRLQTIFEATQLGAGFTIAMKDLEIRGAGNLLGMKQSGHISAVGFNLYTRLLADAVEEQKAALAGRQLAKKPQLPPATVGLPLSAYIPEEYVSDLSIRLNLYQKLARLESVEEVEAMAQEFSDRFGPLPDQVKNLLYAVKIKLLAIKAGIESISTEDSQIVLRRFQGMYFDRVKLAGFSRDGVKVDLTQVRLSPRHTKDWQRVLEGVVRGVS